mgnify:CR=1 FL=1
MSRIDEMNQDELVRAVGARLAAFSRHEVRQEREKRRDLATRWVERWRQGQHLAVTPQEVERTLALLMAFVNEVLPVEF